MENIKMIKLRDHADLKEDSAKWFHEKWGIPVETYLESMEMCLKSEHPVPQWYVVMDDSKIVAGIGVIENDFHHRIDLTPNVCAIFVEKEYRCQGIAGQMLDFVCEDMKEHDIDTLYLVTDHTTFYERYGWKFLCMVHCCDEPALARMYIHQAE